MIEKQKSNIDKTVAELKEQENKLKAARPDNEAYSVSTRRIIIEIIILISSGMLFTLAFPDFNIAFLAWIALVPLYWLVKDKNMKTAWIYGFIWGYSWNVTAFNWLREIEFFIPYIMAGVLALFVAFWAMLVPVLRRTLLIPVSIQLNGYDAEKSYHDIKILNELLLAISLAAWWCIMEWVRTWIATGLPWNLLATSQWKNLPIIQICEFTGVYGVSFLIALINVSIGLAIQSWIRGYKKFRYRRPVPLITAIVLIMISVLIGSRKMIMFGKVKQKKQSIPFIAEVLQGNIPQCRKASDEQALNALKTYLNMSKEAVYVKPDIIIWPETAVPFPLMGNHPFCTNYRFQLTELIKKHKIPFIIGSIDYGDMPDKNNKYPIYNSALLLNEEGKVVDKYRKMHIVPFGEFVPFSDWFPWLVKAIGMGRNLSRGQAFNVLNVYPGVKAGTQICFEDIFPYVSRNQAKNGANLLIIITNDAWYPTSSEPEQHLANAIFRSIETRLPMIRCGNNSCSVLVQPNGVISDSIFQKVDLEKQTYSPFPEKRGKGSAPFEVNVPVKPAMTFYTKYGNVFIFLCFIPFLAAVIMSLLAWKEKKEALLSLTNE